MKKSILCFILIISVIMSVSSFVYGKTPDKSFEEQMQILEALGFLNEEITSLESTAVVTRGVFESAIFKIKNIEYESTSEEFIKIIDAVDIAAHNFGYEFFIGKENTKYGAYKRELLKGVGAGVSDILTVETAVKILYNVIEAPIMIRTGYGSSSTFEVFDDKTPLNEYNDIYSKKGRVTANSLASIDNYKITDENYVRIDDDIYFDNYNFSDYLGHYVKFYYKYDENTDISTILYITKNNDYKTLTITADDIESFDKLTYNYYRNNRPQKVKIPAVHTVILNGEKLEVYESSVYKPQNGNVTLIPDLNGYYDVVIIETFVSVPILSVTAGGTDEIVFTERYTNRVFTVDVSDSDCKFSLYIDGEMQKLKEFTWEHLGTEYKSVTLPQISKYSVANIFADKYKDSGGFIIPADDAQYIKIDITTVTVEGIVDSISSDRESITISGQKYLISDTNNLSKGVSFPKTGEKGIFLFDYDNKITAWAKDFLNNRTLVYAYLINADIEKGLDGRLILKMLLGSGDIKILNARKNLVLNSKSVKDRTEALTMLKSSAKLLDATFEISQLIKFRLDDNGEICEIQTVLKDIGLPDGADPEHIKREVLRDKFYSRSDNGYSLYKYVGDWPNTAYYLKPEIVFSVPPKETFDDDDYNICYTWLPDYSGKVIDIFDLNDYLKPEAVVSYESDSNNIYRPYVMVNEITTELNSKGDIVALLRGYDGYGEMVFYSDDLTMFEGLNEGDLVNVYGFGNKVTKRPQIIVSIEDVKKFDLTDVPKNTVEVSSDCCLYELYSYEGRSLTLQRGDADEKGRRNFQKGAFWTNNVGSLHYGAIVYDAEGREGNRIASAPDLSLMRPVIEYGNEEASKMFVYETSGICRLVVIYNGL